jgi:hypothetical protein
MYCIIDIYWRLNLKENLQKNERKFKTGLNENWEKLEQMYDGLV